MSTRTVLYALTVAVAAMTLPAAASAMPMYDIGPVATPSVGHPVSNGASPLLFVAAALAVVLLVFAVRLVRGRPAAVKA